RGPEVAVVLHRRGADPAPHGPVRRDGAGARLYVSPPRRKPGREGRGDPPLSLSGHQFREALREDRSGALVLVLEVGIHVPPLREDRPEPIRPRGDLLVRVRLLAQAEVPERLEHRLAAGALVSLGRAPRHALVGQDRLRLLPGRIAELHAVASGRWQEAHEVLDQRSVELQRGWTLEQDWAQPVAEYPRAIEEHRYGLVRVAKPQGVRDALVGL